MGGLFSPRLKRDDLAAKAGSSNRNMPMIVVHGPLELGGMRLPTIHLLLQDQWKMHFIIQTLQWDKTTAKDVLTVLNGYQLCSGFVSHILVRIELIIDYVGNGSINHFVPDYVT